MDFCPGFWDWILEGNVDGTVARVSAVAKKLQVDSDQLVQWCRRHLTRFFLVPNQKLYSSVSQVADWVESQSYTPRAIQRFIDSADHILIAHAMVENSVVVTHENPSNSRRKVKIQNVCEAFAVECWTPFEMLRRKKARFVLGECE